MLASRALQRYPACRRRERLRRSVSDTRAWSCRRALACRSRPRGPASWMRLARRCRRQRLRFAASGMRLNGPPTATGAAGCQATGRPAPGPAQGFSASACGAWLCPHSWLPPAVGRDAARRSGLVLARGLARRSVCRRLVRGAMGPAEAAEAGDRRGLSEAKRQLWRRPITGGTSARFPARKWPAISLQIALSQNVTTLVL